MKIKYRPEVDGLRTIAVLAVIIYHAHFKLVEVPFLKGGFLGVDIFFVISGFLITSIIMKELHVDGKFSFLGFYERRARRILPALFLVILTSFPVAWYLLLPNQLVDFAKSILSTIFFGSNFYWLDSLAEYDTESALLKPFLHTWSLAVEEQYYIVFPVILMVIYRWFKSHTVVLLTAGLLLSMGFSDYVTSKNQSLSFYMLPTRFWELLAGSLLANILYFHPQKENDAFLNKTMPILGLYLIGYSLFFISFESNHPGYVTLFPVIGTVLIIWFANEKDLVTRLLSSRLFVGIGLISYSLYLWHYPIFAFGRMIDLTPTWHDKAAWIALTFVLSITAYILVEKPFRDKQKVPQKVLFLSLLTVALIIFAGSSLVLVKNGLSTRLPDILINLETNVLKSRVCEGKQFECSIELNAEKTIFLVGDSHMMPLEKPLARLAKKMPFNLSIMNRQGCQYILNLNRVSKKGDKVDKCNLEFQEKRRKVLLSSKPAIVIMGGRLPLILSEDRFNNGEGGDEGEMKDILQYPDNSLMTLHARQQAIVEEYKKTVSELVEHGHQVILVYPVPEVGWNVPQRLKRVLSGVANEEMETYLLANQITTSSERYFERTKTSFELLDSIKNIYRVYPHELFCNSIIQGRCLTHDTKNSFYRDDDHLSEVGAEMLLDKIIELPPLSNHKKDLGSLKN
jgi:peptidoglycan/LPS O-acetylase OafA/YrhL